MKHPTIQLLLDFADRTVWPFHNFTDGEQLGKVVAKLRLGTNDPLGRYELEQIFRECFDKHGPKFVTGENIERFIELVFEIRQQFGDMLTKEALVDLHRMGLAPKLPRKSIKT